MQYNGTLNRAVKVILHGNYFSSLYVLVEQLRMHIVQFYIDVMLLITAE